MSKSCLSHLAVNTYMPKNDTTTTGDVQVSTQEGKSKDEDSQYPGLVTQIQTEYDLAWLDQNSKVNVSLARLKLYNNQRRNQEAAGDTTLFSIFQTVLASLYSDRLVVEWVGREEGDDEVADNLNALSEFDYTEMGKDIVDFEWIWDTLFFGRGLLDVSEFRRDPDKNIFYPVPKVIDPMTFLRDTRATSINGHSVTGENSCRFFGRELWMGEETMRNNDNIDNNINYENIKFGEGLKSLLKQAKEQRDLAQNLGESRNDAEEGLGDNEEYTITEWHTHYQIDGVKEKVKVWLANERSWIIGLKILKEEKWPVIDRPLYPTSHDWAGTSIPDLVEDKQRARAVALNLGMDAMKADLYPRYLYDTNKIKNRNDLNIAYNKHIGVDGTTDGSLNPVKTATPNLPLLNFIFQTLDVSAQKATATPDIQQGIQSEKDRPLGETNLIAANVDTRTSLSAKIFGWSEKRFWRLYYWMYKEYFADDIDKKKLRIVGAFGPKHRSFVKKDIITPNLDPDIFIESRNVSRTKQLEEMRVLEPFLIAIIGDPTANRRYALKKMGKGKGMKKDELDRLLPMTLDEMVAQDENELLNEGTFVSVDPEDDDNVHLMELAKANDTPATRAHKETHKRAWMEKRRNPQLAPPGQIVNPNVPIDTQGIQGGQPSPQPGSPAQPQLNAGPASPFQTNGQGGGRGLPAIR